MDYEEKCPICGSEDYEVEDYEECYDGDEGSQWWRCICSNNHKFCMEKVFKLVAVNITPEEEENEKVL